MCCTFVIHDLIYNAIINVAALLGMALDLQAQFYLSINRLTEAETLWREAVSVGRQLHGDTGDQVLVVTNSLATVISMQEGRESEAADILENVVETASKLNSTHVTSFLVNLGLVRMKQGLLDAAKSRCEGARRLASSSGDQEVQQEADNCLQQVDLLLAQKRQS